MRGLRSWWASLPRDPEAVVEDDTGRKFAYPTLEPNIGSPKPGGIRPGLDTGHTPCSGLLVRKCGRWWVGVDLEAPLATEELPTYRRARSREAVVAKLRRDRDRRERPWRGWEEA
jgi:hypothetical protein